MLWLPMGSLLAVMMYQATNPALYYLIGMGAYGWAFCEGEVRLRNHWPFLSHCTAVR